MTDSVAQNSSNQNDHNQSFSSYVDQYLPPAPQEPALAASHTQALPPVTPPTAPYPQPTSTNSEDAITGSRSEDLEDQNIFDLLGIADATDDEKEAFLDELQQVIWEDFVEKDVELLLTEEELKEFRAIAEKPTENEEERQSLMIDYLEKLIPDLEKIMLEKALDLKEEMTRERIKEYKELFDQQADKLAKVTEAEKLADDQKWRSAAVALNAIVE